MLNLNELEARHRKYKFKAYIPYALFTTILLIAIVTLVIYDDKPQLVAIKNTTPKKKVIIAKIILDINNSKDANISLKPKIKKPILVKKIKPVIQNIKLKVKDKKVKLSPSLDFMKNMQPNDVYTYENERIIENKTNTVETNTVETKKVTQEKITEKVIEEVIEEKPVLIIKKKSSIKINRNSDISEIQHVIKRFKVNNNPALSLFVAKKYYQIGKYRKSYNYALITNQINNNIEASWIIFAKSLMKLDEQDMAIKTLKKYIDHSHSSQAKMLLDEIQSGKFK